MSKYTTELRFICESLANNDISVDNTGVNNVIEVARQKIFDFDYNIFDDSYKPVLETKILRHYYFREIGFETYGLFKFHLQTKLNEIMPYYNQMYKSELINFNPLYEVDLLRTKDNTNDKTENKTNAQSTATDVTSKAKEKNTVENNTTAKNTNTKTLDTETANNETKSNKHQETITNQNTNLKLFQDTPQNNFGNNLDNSYLTNRTKTTDNGSNGTTGSYTDTINSTVADTGTIIDSATSSETNTVTEDKSRDVTDKSTTSLNSKLDVTAKTTEQYLEKVQGKSSSKSYSKLLQEYRQTFLNIDMLIINELEDLFFSLW